MTVAALTPSISYTENGVTLNFAVPFRFDPAGGLVVKRVLAGAVTTLAHGTGWTATGGATDAGGTLTLLATVAGAVLRIDRATPRAQQTDYATNDNFPAETHEAAIDRLMMIAQEQDVALAAGLERTVRFGAGESGYELPGAATRANRVLGFDGDGMPLLTTLPAVPAAGLDAALLNFASPVGPGVESVANRLRASISMHEFMTNAERLASIARDPGLDMLAAVQRAYDALQAGTISDLFWPDGYYNLNGSVQIPSNVQTGWHVQGQSVRGTVIRQLANNAPMFNFSAVDLFHSHHWHHFSAIWPTLQGAYPNASVFTLRGKPLSNMSFYNSTISHIYSQGGYRLIDAPDCLWWGNEVSRIFFSTQGGFTRLQGAAGQPHCVFEKIYTNGGKAGEVMMIHERVAGEYDVEMTGCAAAMLSDGGGGDHVVRNLTLEVGNFTTNTTLINVTNGRLRVAGRCYAITMTLGAGVQVYFVGGGSPGGYSEMDLALLEWSFNGGIAAQGAGSAFYVANFTSGAGRKARIRSVNGEISAYGASPVAALTNFGGSAAANYVEVLHWNDPHREQVVTGNTTLTFDGPRRTLIGSALAAPLDIVLPPHGSAVGQSMFTGLIKEVVKLASAGTAHPIRIYYSDGVTLLTQIPAATASGTVRIRYDRSNPAGTGGGPGFWTVEPALI